jgi:hypothetical protein
VRALVSILKNLLELLGIWVVFFIVVMGCFVVIMWVHKRISGESVRRRRRDG